MKWNTGHSKQGGNKCLHVSTHNSVTRLKSLSQSSVGVFPQVVKLKVSVLTLWIYTAVTAVRIVWINYIDVIKNIGKDEEFVLIFQGSYMAKTICQKVI